MQILHTNKFIFENKKNNVEILTKQIHFHSSQASIASVHNHGAMTQHNRYHVILWNAGNKAHVFPEPRGKKYDVISEAVLILPFQKQKKTVFYLIQRFSVKNMDFFCKIYRFFLECRHVPKKFRKKNVATTIGGFILRFLVWKSNALIAVHYKTCLKRGGKIIYVQTTVPVIATKIFLKFT